MQPEVSDEEVAKQVRETLARLTNKNNKVGKGAKYRREKRDAIRQGVEMIMTQFNTTMEKLGVTEIESLGQKFDPAFHNAVMHVEDAEKGENEIVSIANEEEGVREVHNLRTRRIGNNKKIPFSSKLLKKQNDT